MICIRSQRRSPKLHGCLCVSHVHWAGGRQCLISPSHPRIIRSPRWLNFLSCAGSAPFLALSLLQSLSLSLSLSCSRWRPRCTPPRTTTLTHYYFCLTKTNTDNILPVHTANISTRARLPRVRSNPSHILSTTTHGWRCDRGVTLSASHAAASLLRLPVGRDAPLPAEGIPTRCAARP